MGLSASVFKARTFFHGVGLNVGEGWAQGLGPPEPPCPTQPSHPQTLEGPGLHRGVHGLVPTGGADEVAVGLVRHVVAGGAAEVGEADLAGCGGDAIFLRKKKSGCCK